MSFNQAVEAIGRGVDVAGVMAIAGGIGLTTLVAAGRLWRRADDEAHALIREALTGSGDIQPADGALHVRLEPLSAPRRTAALTALCDQLNATHTRYPGTNLVLHYQVKPHPDIA